MIVVYRSPKYSGGCYMTTGFYAAAAFVTLGAAPLDAGFWCALSGSSGRSGGGEIEELGQ